MADNMNKELFLDILTKDEREALLTKKMEEIRKKNEALRKRHEEIEADKRVAAKENPNTDVNSYSRDAVQDSASPRKESKPLPGEEKRGHRPSKAGGRGRGQGGGKPKEKRPQGPPPDPSYNFLADRRREGSSKEAPINTEFSADKSPRKGESRRHPKNYGGQDFNNVKAQIRTSKERQERPKSGPPRTKMELAMSMTGKERKQYMEWKAERERVDLERLERQKSNTGEWRRAWDADKHQQDFEQPPSPQRTEPAKRPAGRIGSGRFDRGEREERQRGDAPRLKAGVRTEADPQSKPVGRGRARGRARGRGRGERSPRQRTFSSGDESRKVERQKDLLVVKIDNSVKDTNQSVEVEYWDDDVVDVKSNSAASVRSGTSHSSHSNKRVRCHEDSQFDDLDDGQDRDNGFVVGHRRHTHSQSLGDENEHDESWEDCPEDAEFYADDYADGDDQLKGPLKLECKLNPDAPEFTPTSPDFMKTPPGHVKVMDWVTEVNSNLSPTSPPPTMDGVDNEECKKALFKDDNLNDAGKEQNLSKGGVTKTTMKSCEEELSASYTVEKEPSMSAAPEASDEFLDASGDLEEQEEKQEPEDGADYEKPEEMQQSPANGTTDSVLPIEDVSVEQAPDQSQENKDEVKVDNMMEHEELKGKDDLRISSPDTVGLETCPAEDCKTESLKSTESICSDNLPLTSKSVSAKAYVDASYAADAFPAESTDVKSEQMAESDSNTHDDQSGKTLQSKTFLVQDIEPSADEKSSLSEKVEVKTPASQTTSPPAAEDFHAE